MIPNQMAEVERFQLNTVESSEDYLQDSKFEQIAVKQAGKFEYMTKFSNNVKN